MAAIPVAALVAGAAAVGSAAVTSAAAGITALAASSKMSHSMTSLSDTLELRAGHHISYNISGSIQHAIIIQQHDGDRWELVFLTGSYGAAHISCEKVDLEPYLSSLCLHNYNPLVCYALEDVANRAKSLAEEYNEPERHSVIRDYWNFFKDGEHFAVWCQTGVSFGTVLYGMFSSDYKFTVIRNVSYLREGDHVCYKIGVGKYAHGIVAGVGEDPPVLNLVTFSGKPNETVILENFKADKSVSTGQLYRYDYDVAIGDDAQMTLTRAMAEVDLVHCSSYKDSEQFAVWCKTGNRDYSTKDASTLAKARAVGRVCTLVQAKNMLKVGDHIAYKPGAVHYQHAIVVAVDDTMLDIVKLPRDVKDDENWTILRGTIDAGMYIRKGHLFKYFHDVSEWKSSEVVTARAVVHVGVVVWRTPFKDSLHFAAWCKTGLYQLHGATEFADL